MSEYMSLPAMLASLRKSQQDLLAALAQADDDLLYRRSGEDSWTLAENLVHIAEARQFFAAEIRKALAASDVTIGRTITHPGRLQNIQDHGHDSRASIQEQLATSHKQISQLLEGLNEQDLQKTVTHVKYGQQALADFITHFIVEHDQAHARQAQALIGRH